VPPNLPNPLLLNRLFLHEKANRVLPRAIPAPQTLRLARVAISGVGLEYVDVAAADANAAKLDGKDGKEEGGEGEVQGEEVRIIGPGEEVAIIPPVSSG
ncbi:hypothetical protein I7I51_04117, partial [Histoplasma capsulatum]